jgi:hypothetical protein
LKTRESQFDNLRERAVKKIKNYQESGEEEEREKALDIRIDWKKM